MKIFFDTEFIEDGKTIDLISIGLVREDGQTLYLENVECDRTKASPWVVENVFPHLDNRQLAMRKDIANKVKNFVGLKPEFWAYYADYDWVALCQLYGTMMELPDSWPNYCRDLKQTIDDMGLEIKQEGPQHNALNDARWVKMTYDFIFRGRERGF